MLGYHGCGRVKKGVLVVCFGTAKGVLLRPSACPARQGVMLDNVYFLFVTQANIPHSGRSNSWPYGGDLCPRVQTFLVKGNVPALDLS
jgi:hypothetical protein